MIAFGPVPSRRLGLSLGINNIVSLKDCSYSCIYCQIGATRDKTITRKPSYEPGKLFEEVQKHLEKLDVAHKPDYLTFVANGDPTLDINLGEEIQMLKQLNIPIAIISNASLINQEDVRTDLMNADWVSLKVDSVNEQVWRSINRPHPELNLKAILEGITCFAAVYKGRLQTETMLIDQVNDSPELLEQNARFITTLNPESAYLSLPTRPPALKTVHATTEANLARAWHIYSDHRIKTELLAGFEGTNTGYTGNAFEDILNISAVHPVREDTMEALLEKDQSDFSVVESLLSQRLIKKVKYNNLSYYVRSYNF
jgi:wyosine [tRNA(Phe)-imidazoG37] synthetase (radical SAM superfamily)